MDTLAYAFSDIFELGEGLLTGAKKKSNPKIRLSLWIILLLLFLAYCTFEIVKCFESYHACQRSFTYSKTKQNKNYKHNNNKYQKSTQSGSQQQRTSRRWSTQR